MLDTLLCVTAAAGTVRIRNALLQAYDAQLYSQLLHFPAEVSAYDGGLVSQQLVSYRVQVIGIADEVINTLFAERYPDGEDQQVGQAHQR